MIQLLFFTSMIAIAALMINLLWYLDDSYEEESRFVNQNCRNRQIAGSSVQHSTIGRINRKSKSKNLKYNINNVNNIHMITNHRKMTSFYDVGTSSGNANESLSKNQSVCA